MNNLPTSSQRYPSIDGLRAFAAIGIALMHYRVNVVNSPAGNFLYDTVIPRFTDFVYMFFVISAFSLCCGYYEKFKTGKITPSAFYKKRYMRILPFFAILIIINALLPHAPNKYAAAHAAINSSGFSPIVETIFESFADLTLGYALLPNPHISVIGVGWFLGVIFLFYMLFPFFVFMIDNKKSAWISLMISYIFSFIALAYFFGPKFIDFSLTRHNIIYDLTFFVLGGLIYLYKQEIYQHLSKHKTALLFLAIVITIGYWLWNCNKYWFIVKVGIWSSIWLIYALCSNGKLLNNKVTRYLSGISMEIYLCHMMLFRGVGFLHLEKYIDNIHICYWMTCVLGISGAILFSHVVKYYLIQRMLKK